jgi:hypothetical protein
MQPSLSSYLDFLSPWISPALVSAPYLSSIKRLSCNLPVLSFGCFECWLGPDEPRVDFNIAINPKLNEQVAFINWLAEEAKRDKEPAEQRWEKISIFFHNWRAGGYYLQDLIKVVWLVYDVADPLAPSPVPWIYVHFRLTFLNKDPEIRTEIILQVMSLWKENWFPSWQEKMRTFLHAISPAVQILAVGKTTNRGDQNLRIYLLLQSFQDLLDFLSDHAWMGKGEDLREKLAVVGLNGDFYCLSLDLGPDLVIRPKIGIEYWAGESRAQHHLIKFTHHLQDHGLCTEAKRAGLLRWNGRFNLETNLDFWSWPDQLGGVRTDRPKKQMIKRMANYIKMIYEPDRPLLAKAYLYFDRPV